jgi:DNA-binding NarL/FixJ family response regulator
MGQYLQLDNLVNLQAIEERENAPSPALNRSFRVVLADDHKMFRDGLRSFLGRRPELEIVAEVERAADLRAAIEAHRCDIVILDLQMDRWMMSEIVWLARSAIVAVLTASESLDDAVNALKHGARAVIPKRLAVHDLIEAISALIEGRLWLPDELQAEIVARLNASPTSNLTVRESQIARYVALGLRNAEIARRLSITEATVKSHLNNTFQKLGLRDRSALIRYAIRCGLVTMADTEH